MRKLKKEKEDSIRGLIAWPVLCSRPSLAVKQLKIRSRCNSVWHFSLFSFFFVASAASQRLRHCVFNLSTFWIISPPTQIHFKMNKKKEIRIAPSTRCPVRCKHKTHVPSPRARSKTLLLSLFYFTNLIIFSSLNVRDWMIWTLYDWLIECHLHLVGEI